MKCPHCHKEFTPSPKLWELKYMIGKGWLFGGLIENDKWKTDSDLPGWLQRGWVEMSGHGFRITKAGEAACQNNQPEERP